MNIRTNISLAELMGESNFYELIDEYANECANPDLPSPNPKWEMYDLYEKAGILTIIAAYDDDLLVGFMVALATILPHYGVKMMVSESIFVTKRFRKSGAGLMLINAAESQAERLGCKGFYFTAPYEMPLDKVLKRIGYRHTNNVYFKKV